MTLGEIYGNYKTGLAGLGDCSNPAIQAKIFNYADRYGIDRSIAFAQIKQESGCRSSVCSHQGACGIAQFIESTAAAYGVNRSDVDSSLDGWGRYMRHLLNKFSGDYRLALAGYHSGEGAARAALNNCPGNPNTCHYVNVIMSAAGRGLPVGNNVTTSPGPLVPYSTNQTAISPLMALAIGAGIILLTR